MQLRWSLTSLSGVVEGNTLNSMGYRIPPLPSLAGLGETLILKPRSNTSEAGKYYLARSRTSRGHYGRTCRRDVSLDVS